MSKQKNQSTASGDINNDFRRSSSERNPYIDARREWSERYGSYIQAAHQWRLVALGMLAITALAVGGVVYMGNQNHFIPYVVQVDKLGTAVAAGRADTATRADARIIRAQIARWVWNTRSVFVDAAAQRSAIDDAYAMIGTGGSSYKVLTDFYRRTDPFERASKETATIEVHSVLSMGAGNTWRVEWTETTRGRNGEVQRAEEWQAIVTVVVSPPDTELTILKNPLGIYVVEFAWSQREKLGGDA